MGETGDDIALSLGDRVATESNESFIQKQKNLDSFFKNGFQPPSREKSHTLPKEFKDVKGDLNPVRNAPKEESGGRSKTISVKSPSKVFGISLKDLMKKAPHGSTVPAVVKQTCHFISKYGMKQEGIFRISCNKRSLNDLQDEFDQRHEPRIPEDCDVMVVAGLLKLFFRELPEAVIPKNRTQKLMGIHENNKDVADVVPLFKKELQKLPDDNFNLLKYLCQLLVVVAHYEDYNKMSPMALGIVFGPNIFRCLGKNAVQDQTTANQILCCLILKYDSIFKLAKEDSPVQAWEKRYEMTSVSSRPSPRTSSSSDTSSPKGGIFSPIRGNPTLQDLQEDIKRYWEKRRLKEQEMSKNSDSTSGLASAETQELASNLEKDRPLETAL